MAEFSGLFSGVFFRGTEVSARGLGSRAFLPVFSVPGRNDCASLTTCDPKRELQSTEKCITIVRRIGATINSNVPTTADCIVPINPLTLSHSR